MILRPVPTTQPRTVPQIKAAMGIVVPVLLLGIWTGGRHLAHAFSGGAPENSCPTMRPLHGVPKQSTPSPYSVSVSSQEIAPSQTVKVTINGSEFSGFLASAHSSDFPVGSLTALSDSAKVICNGEYVTHVSPILKRQVSFEWKAPDDVLEGTLIDFRATVVKERVVFWMDVVQPYPVVIVKTPVAVPPKEPAGGAQNTTVPGGVLPTPGTAAPATSPAAVDVSTTATQFQFPGHLKADKDCGKRKACFHDCQKSGHCTFIVSWNPQKREKGEGKGKKGEEEEEEEKEEDTLTFTITYRLPDANQHWIAVGFSKDQEMGDDSVTECIMNEGEVEVLQSHNQGLDNKYLDDRHAGLTEMGGSIEDGILSCSFRRKKTYPRDPMVFDLHEKYFLLVAMGEGLKGVKLPHTFDVLPPVSDHKINFSALENGGPGKEPPASLLVQIHGALMMISWVMLTSVGVMTAKYGKMMFPKVNPCRANIWFHIHRGCMVTVTVMTVVGVILMFVQCEGYCHIPQVPGKSHWPLHPPLGLLVLILTALNPIMAIFRPAPKAPNRFVFNWSHWGVGVLAWIMASFAILIGLTLERAHAPPEALYVMVVWGIYHVVILVAMEMLPRPLCKLYSAVAEKTLQRGRVYNLERAQQDNLGYLSDEGHSSVDTPQALDTPPDPTPKKDSQDKELTREELKVQKTLLLVHYGVVAVLTFTLLLLVYLYTPSSSSSSSSH